jgi:hypothetical protein
MTGSCRPPHPEAAVTVAGARPARHPESEPERDAASTISEPIGGKKLREVTFTWLIGSLLGHYLARVRYVGHT